MKYPFDIFISHSSKDTQLARYLAMELKHAGFSVWFDEWKIELGDDIYLEIERGIEQSRCMLILMSRNYFESDWITFERSSVGFRDPSNKDKTLLPVLIEECTIPDSLRKFQHFDLTEQNTDRIKGIIRKLGTWMGKDAKRALFATKVDAESKKDKIPITQGRRGDTYEDIVAFAFGNKLSALLFFDIDGFSYVNAKCGVGIGEKIITAIEEILRKNAPEGSYIARWNADEFVCVIPGLENSKALETAKSLVSSINTFEWSRLEESLFLTVSCGVSVFRRRGSLKEVEWVEAAMLGARSVKINGGGDARIGTAFKSSPSEVAKKVRAPLEYLDRYGS